MLLASLCFTACSNQAPGERELSLQASLNAAQVKVASLQARYDVVAGQKTRLESEAVQLRAEIAQTKTALEESKDHAARTLTAQKEGAAANFAAQKDTAAALQLELEKVRLEKRASADQEQAAALKKLQTGLNDAQVRYASLQAKYEVVAGLNSRLQDELAQTKAAQATTMERSVNASTAALRREVDTLRQELAQARADRGPSNPANYTDISYLVLKKVFAVAKLIRTGAVDPKTKQPISELVPARWEVTFQGSQTGRTYSAVVVTDAVARNLTEGKAYAKDEVRGLVP